MISADAPGGGERPTGSPEIAGLVESLAAQDVRLFLDGDRLQVAGSREAVVPALLDTVRARRAEIVAFLKEADDASRSHPLTAGQQSLLLHQRLTPDSAAYNLAFAARVPTGSDPDVLDAALLDVVADNPILRTTYDWGDGEPWQRAAEIPERLLVVDSVPADDVDSAVEAFMDQPFDLENGLPIRAMLLGTGQPDDEPVLVLVVHHIAADLQSIDVIVEAWLAGYLTRRGDGEALLPGGPRFAEHARGERAWLASTDARRNLEFWREYLDGGPSAVTLPFDRPRSAVQTFQGACVTLEFEAALSAQLTRVASDADVTVNMLFLSAFQVLLHRYSGSQQVPVGTPAAGRRGSRTHRTVGFFADPVVVRGELGDDPPFTTVLDRTRGTLLRVLDHPYPFPLLVENLNPPRDPSRSPFFQVMYVWQQTSTGPELMPLRPLDSSRQRGAPYDLVLAVRQEGQRFVGSWTYNTDLFDRSTIERIARGFTAMLEDIAVRPEARVSSLPSMSVDEQLALVRESSGPSVDIGDHGWLDQFVAQAECTPRAVALVCDGEALTYEELADQAARLASALAARGLGEEDLVGVCIERSITLVVVMLAIAWTGAGYVPLDPSYPADRIGYMVSDARVSLCVADGRGRRVLGAYDGPTVTVQELAGAAAGLAPAAVRAAATEALAYVIYTSGSTGRPKGVMVTRRNVVNLFAGLDSVIGEEAGGAQPVWLAVTSVCFDISVLELLWTLCRGHRVVVETGPWTSGQVRTKRVLARPVEFSVFYFAAEAAGRTGGELYRLLLDGARFADANGFRAVWVPERHFHSFGGAYPNPAVLAGAVAAATSNVEIRAGSVVLPLQDPLRVAEEWAVVDNLSDGRVGLSFASGWQPDDFVLAPDRFADRRETMWRDVDVVRGLWRGEPVRRRNGSGNDIDVRTLPRPVRPELPVWATAAGSDETFRRAGQSAANLLTHLLGQNIAELTRKIGIYRAARAAAGHDEGVVTLMLHTFVHPDAGFVRETVSGPFRDYLRSSIDLMRGLATSLGLDPERDRDVLVEHAVERFFSTSALFGTPETCAELVRELAGAGVDEIACLIDFGVQDELALDALTNIVTIQQDLAGNATEPHTPAVAIARHGVTDLQCTPALARLLLLEHESGAQAGAWPRRLLVGGEAVSPQLGARLSAAGISEIFNMYGPTEACVWSAVHRIEPDEQGRVVIGGPIANTVLYVLDDRLRPVPAGVAGELYIGGAGVGRGYLNRPAMTAERFLPDPFGPWPGARVYATGDVVRSLGGGRFEFLGRVDDQVKVRGFRVEVGEVEAVLAAHPAVAGSTVIARQDADGDAVLLAFVVHGPGEDHDEAVLLQHIRGTLPEYMVPSRIVAVERIPLTPNGKVDREALARRAGEASAGSRAPVAPRNHVEDELLHLWTELLGAEGVGVHENFFEIGGHSLLAAKLHARIVTAGLGRIDLVDIFTYPTIARLAARMDAGPDPVAGPDSRASKQRAALRGRRDQRAKQHTRRPGT